MAGTFRWRWAQPLARCVSAPGLRIATPELPPSWLPCPAPLFCRPYQVGAGALGCEFLKNFALMGVACGEQLLHMIWVKQTIRLICLLLPAAAEQPVLAQAPAVCCLLWAHVGCITHLMKPACSKWCYAAFGMRSSDQTPPAGVARPLCRRAGPADCHR